jgi:predicted dehydrogenase
MAKLRIGIIGTGHLGKHHARIYTEIPGVELAGVCDIDEKTASKMAAKLKTEYFTDYEDMLEKVQAVSIVTPTATHFRIAEKFLKKGIHTLVEKPITNNPEHARALIDAASVSSSILQVGHVERYNGAVMKAREFITNPMFIEVNRISRFPDRSLDIGVVLDLMIHDIDIILSFVDSDITRVDSVGSSVFSGKEDIANCRLMFQNGCVANITASRVSYKSERKFRVFESDSYLSLDYEKQEFVVYRKKSDKVNSPADVQRIVPKIEKTEPLREELSDFIRCIREDKEPAVGGYQGLSALEVALDITGRL